jgi:hypothetical protein
MTPDPGSGMAYWNEVTGVPLNGQVDGVVNGCANGYYPYPYQALNDKDGTPFTISDSGPYRTNTVALTTIPINLANDTQRTVESAPKRVCRSVIVANGTANVWSTTSSSCVNKCVGYSVNPDTNVGTGDKRIGAGRTQHSISDPANNHIITVNWPDTNFGSTAYMINPLSGQDASHYRRARANGSGLGYYALARKCNENTHKWDNVVPQCVANNGMIIDDNNTETSTDDFDTNAKYSNTDNSPYVPFGNSPTKSSCNDNYKESDYKDNGDKTPIRNYTCSYKDNLKYIDQLYFDAIENSGKKCVKYCDKNNIPAGHTYSGNTYTEANTTITLGCQSGYGKALDGGTSGSYDNSCGRNAYDRTDIAPTIKCDANGTWETVLNPCIACRGCTTSSEYDKISCQKDNLRSGNRGFFSYKTNYMFGGGSEEYIFNTFYSNDTSKSTSISHNGLTSCATGYLKGVNGWGTLQAKCVDNKFLQIQSKCGAGGNSICGNNNCESHWNSTNNCD